MKRANLSVDVRTLFKSRLEKGLRPSPMEYSQLIQLECKTLSTIFVVIDALDECKENSGSRDHLLRELNKLQPKLRLLVTSRPHIIDVAEHFPEAAQLSIHAKEEDIRKYLNRKISTHARFRCQMGADHAFQNLVMDTIIQNAKGMFVLHTKLPTYDFVGFS
jgi:hypothetical protein